jgi:hypothetical protein
MIKFNERKINRQLKVENKKLQQLSWRYEPIEKTLSFVKWLAAFIIMGVYNGCRKNT